MTHGPSEHSKKEIEDPLQEVYHAPLHGDVEQSAIYAAVPFSCFDEKGEVGYGIVLTSQCDLMDDRRQDYLLLARLVPLEMFFLYFLKRNNYTEEEIAGTDRIEGGRKNRKNILSKFTSSYLSGNVYGYYFLPAYPERWPHSLVCFEIVQAMHIETATQHEKVCVLSSPFREAVPAKFASYIGRIGTPSYPKGFFNPIMDEICKLRD